MGGDQQHNFMGYLTFKIEELASQDPIKGWFELKKENNDQIVSGEICLMIKYTYSQEWNLAYNGALSLAMENYDDAILSLTEAISNIKDTNVENYIAQLYKFRALAYHGTGKYSDAINDITFAISKDQRNHGFWFTKGKIYFDQGEYDKARETFQTGLQHCPNNELLKSSLKEIELNSIALKTAKTLKEVLSFFEEGRYHEAASLLTRTLINNYPNNYLYLWYRSLAHLGNNKMEDAEKDIMKLTTLNPNWTKENPRRQGELRKQGEVNILFKRRYFYLKNHYLFYYKKRDDLLPKGVILLCYGTKIQQKDKDIYIDASRRVFRLQAKSEKEANDWKIDIIAAIKEELTFSPEQSVDNLQLQGDSFTYKRSFPLEKILKYRSNQFRHTQVVAEGIDFEGYLYKRGGFNTNWKRRYFILKKDHLYYFVDKPIAKDNVYSSVKDYIVVSKYSPQDLQDPPHAFQLVSNIPGERIYYFYADTEEIKEKWKLALNNAIERSKAALSNDSVSLLKNPSRKTILLKETLSTSSDSEVSNKTTPKSDTFKESTIIKVRDETQKIDRFGVSSSERKYFRKFDLEYDSTENFFGSRSNENYNAPKSYESESLGDLVGGDTDDETEFLLNKSYSDYGELEKSKCCSSCTIL